MKMSVTLHRFCAAVGLVCLLASCSDWIYENRDGCEHGIWLSFKYDYNLQRADMMEHVGSVGVFVYDEQGRFVTSYIDPDIRRTQPYRMYIDLPEGNYQFLALAQQRSFESVQAGPGANFVWETPVAGDAMDDFAVSLEADEVDAGWALVQNEQEPLDTLWHAVSTEPVYVAADRYVEHTLSLMRDTKSITVSMREIDEPETMNVADYDFAITHRGLQLVYDREAADLVSGADSRTAIHTPYATWNTGDDDQQTLSAMPQATVAGQTAHAAFMTSRLYAGDVSEENARLTIRHRATEHDVVDVDLCNLLGQLRNYDEIQRYGLQEFLDRGYDFRLTFFLKGGEWQYVDVSIGVLDWSKRVQNVSL